MIRENGESSQTFRSNRADTFRKIEGGKFGGYKKGVKPPHNEGQGGWAKPRQKKG